MTDLNNSEYHLHRATKNIFVEFLRGVSIEDHSGKVYAVESAIWRMIEALGEIDSDKRRRALSDAIGECLDYARDIGPCPANPHDVHYHARELASSAGKVLAERISGQATQLTLAESRMFAAFRIMEDARAINRRSMRP